MKGKEGSTDSELLDKAIATAMEQTVGLNLATSVSLFVEKIATATSPDGGLHHLGNSSYRVYHELNSSISYS